MTATLFLAALWSNVLPPRLLPWPFNSFGKFIWKRTLDTPGKSIVRLPAAFLAASSYPTSSTRRVSKHLHRDIRGSPPCYGFTFQIRVYMPTDSLLR